MKSPPPIVAILWLAAAALLLSGGQIQGCGLAPSGPRTLIIAHEGQNTPKELAALEVQLRDGPAAKTLADRGCKLLILDNEDEVIAKYRPFDDAKPELLIEAGGKLVSRQAVPGTVEDFLRLAP